MTVFFGNKVLLENISVGSLPHCLTSVSVLRSGPSLAPSPPPSPTWSAAGRIVVAVVVVEGSSTNVTQREREREREDTS